MSVKRFETSCGAHFGNHRFIIKREGAEEYMAFFDINVGELAKDASVSRQRMNKWLSGSDDRQIEENLKRKHTFPFKVG